MALNKVKIYHPELGESEVLAKSVPVWEERGWSTKQKSSTSSTSSTNKETSSTSSESKESSEVRDESNQ